MSATTVGTWAQGIDRSRQLRRSLAADRPGRGNATARKAGTNKCKASGSKRVAAALVTSLLILLTATAGTPRAVVSTQRDGRLDARVPAERLLRPAEHSTPLRGGASAGSSNDFARLRERITARLLSFEPEELRMLGQKEAGGRLKDWSPAAIAEEVAFCRQAIKELNAAAVETPEEVLDRDVLLSNLNYLEHYYGSYHGELGNLQISVYPYDVIQYELLRFATGDGDARSARDQYGAVEGVLRGLPGYLQQQQSNLLAGLKLRAPDKEILDSIMNRIGWPGDRTGIRAGLFEIGQRLEEEELKDRLPDPQREGLRRLLKEADAAYKRHLNFLETQIAPHARDSWALGREEYVLRLRLLYGYRGTLEDLVRPAEAELRRLKKQMKSLAQEVRPEAPRTDTIHLRVLDELRQDVFRNEEELLSAYRQAQQKIDAALTTRLGLPTGKAQYRKAPAGVPVSTATNWPAPPLAPGPPIVLVNTWPKGLIENFRANIAWVAAHEGNPGHAAQSALFQSAFKEGQAPLCRFLNVPDEVGYVRGNWYAMANIEGWAFYTERLLFDEKVLSPEERLAALTGQALRAARVVVDVRMHTEGWSRARVAEYLVSEAGLSCADAQGQAFRYSKIPLQAVSYFMGAGQFGELHRKYGERLGGDFYARVLSLGPVPPTLIDKYLEASTLGTK